MDVPRTGKTGSVTLGDRVVVDSNDHDGDRRGDMPSGPNRRFGASRDDDVHSCTDEFGCEDRKPLGLTLRASEFQGEVLALDVTESTQLVDVVVIDTRVRGRQDAHAPDPIRSLRFCEERCDE